MGTAAAVAAARSMAAAAGLGEIDPEVVGDGSNRIVRLGQSGLVARVMTGTAFLHRDPQAWLRRELAVVGHLAAAGAPVVAPATAVDPGPYRVGGVWGSLWEHVELVRAGDVRGGQVGARLRELHDALAACPEPLPARSEVCGELDALLVRLDGRVATTDLGAWRAERDRLAPLLTGLDRPALALHGDASLSNLLATTRGLLWNDFEDVCRGAPAWDLAGLLDDARGRRGEAFADEVAAAYGAHPDEDAVELVRRVGALYSALWRAHLRTRD